MGEFSVEDIVRAVARRMAEEGLTLRQARSIFEYEFMRAHLRNAGDNVSKASKTLGVNRVTVHRCLNKSNAE